MLSIEKLKSRNLKNPNIDDDDDEEKLAGLTHVRMDRENISKIENLDVLQAVTHLYLQKNCIKVIENLTCLSLSLRFLTLAGNNISIVEGLQVLHVLAFLDLSDNFIESFSPIELPQSLVFVVLTGNLCSTLPNYRNKLINNLPNLKSIDNELIISSDDSSSEEDDSDDDTITDGNDADVNEIHEVSLDLLDRSSSRMDEVLEEHHARLKDINGPKKDSLFVDIEKQIKTILDTMVNAERTAMNRFEILPPPASQTATSPPPTAPPSVTPRSEPDADSSLDREATELREDILRCISARGPTSRPFFASVGTTSGKSSTFREYTITPSSGTKQDKRVGRKKSGSCFRSGKESVTTRRTSAYKEKRKISSSVVRIPGARPFFKS